MTTPIYDPLEEELVSLPEASQEDYDVQPVNEFVPIEEPTERPIESILKVEEVEEPKMKVAGASETTDGETENNENIESNEDKEEPIEDPL